MRAILLILALAASALAAAAQAPGSAPDAAAEADARPGPTLTYYAGMPARLTMDRDGQGGNPFASALVKVLEDPGVTLAEFGGRLAAWTFRYAGGWQSPDLPRALPPIDFRFGEAGGRRLALVLVNSDYSAAGATSLPGARHDADRVPAALGRAGFETTRVLDASAEEVRRALAEFSRASADAEAALIYIGGHGVQHKRVVYWLMGDYPEPRSAAPLATHAFAVPELAKAARARTVNLVLYAACRDDPFHAD